uniref:DPY30 domain-containing protein n=1 Tax=Strongyloides papillosus TaxID=174720 RepID=A0A0N5BHM4_STREA
MSKTTSLKKLIEDPTDLCSQCIPTDGTTSNKKKELLLFALGLFASIAIKLLSMTTYGKKILEWLCKIEEYFPDTEISDLLRSATAAATTTADTTTTNGDDKEFMDV